jgi:hypothetical protein
MFVQDDQIRFARRDQRSQSGGLPLHVPCHAMPLGRCRVQGYDGLGKSYESGVGIAALGLLFHPDSTSLGGDGDDMAGQGREDAS